MTVGLVLIGLAIAMNACVLGWNAAAHRMAIRDANVMAILFYAFAVAFLIVLVKAILF
jgi:hypothetical protein